MKRGRTIIGVVGTEVHSIEQRQILSGILEQARHEDASVAVFANIFNPLEAKDADCCENQIYNLILSQEIDALIMLSESFVNERLRENIFAMIRQRGDIPVMTVGAAQPEWDAPPLPHISTSDENDMEEITDHLIDCHGFRDIALLTGPQTVAVSAVRVRGYRKSLEKHGIAFDAEKVYAGDFWYGSGEALAKRYLSGELPMPEALICANDYMAFGVLDAFEYAGVNLLDKMAVVGYEFIAERNLHTPLLTTYQRNRSALGRAAVEMLMRRLRGEPEQPFQPPRGRLIHGVTCSCDVSRARQHEELVSARREKQYADWSLKSDMERKLTESAGMEEFARTLGEFMFMVRDVSDIYLCLCENWYRQEAVPASDVLLCRSVNPWADKTEFRMHNMHISDIIMRADAPASFYYTPLFFKDRLFGFCVLQYNHPDTYDDTYRHWLKSVANGLEFLRLKADVRYLLQCRTLSVSYDSMTGVFSANGLQSAYLLMQSAAKTQQVSAVFVRFGTAGEVLNAPEPLVQSLLAAAEVLQRFQGNGGICGRLSELEFLLLYPSAAEVSAQMLADAVRAELICAGAYEKTAGVDSFLCMGQELAGGMPFAELTAQLSQAAAAAAEQASRRRLLRYEPVLRAVRSEVYGAPSAEHSLEACAAALGLNTDYFNRKYKECFSVSFHQDCISSRIVYARHLLMRGEAGIAEVGEACGYADSKYFIRQFTASAGLSPHRYRQLLGMYCR